MRKYISPEVEFNLFETEDFIQTSGISVNSLVKNQAGAVTVQWGDVVNGSESLQNITE